MSGPVLSLVVSTIGRSAELERLCASVPEDVADRVELVLVDQSADAACIALVGTLELPFPVTTATSPRGLSLGRNTGLALARGCLVAFPDDDCWYASETLRRVLARFDSDPSLGLLSGIQRTPDGRPSMLRWEDAATGITRRNFYRTSISSTLFVRRPVLDLVGGFDVDLGAGSAKGYGSGEESDLVLRVVAAHVRAEYDPAITVFQDDPRDDDPGPPFVAKMASYGRGFGRVYRLHHLSPVRLSLLASRKLAAAGVRTAQGDRDLARADLAFVRGMLTGYRAAPSPRSLHVPKASGAG